MPLHRKDGLWMELDSFNRKLSMSNAHYLIIIDRLGGHLEAFRQALFFRDKRMVSRSLEGALYSTENYSAAERVNNPLMSEANPQCRGLVAHFSKNSRACPKVPDIAGGAGTRRDYDP